MADKLVSLELGGMGVVYRARQDSPRRDVALKVVHPGTLGGSSLRRFAREAEMLAEAEMAAIAEAERRSVVIVGSHRWHPGVIWIAAGRLKDRLSKPTIVLGGVTEHEPAKGSGRSTPGVEPWRGGRGGKGSGAAYQWGRSRGCGGAYG